MRKLVFCILLSMPVFVCAQRIKQKGWVTELNSNKAALAGVQIEYDEAPSTTSDDGGYFVLSFLGKKYGDLIFMSIISKLGYEVVNEKELLCPTLSKDKIKIVLCKRGLLDKMRTEYYDISKKALNNGYNDQLQQLKIALKDKRIQEKDYFVKLNKLQEQLAKSEEKVFELAEKYAHTNFDDVSDEYRQAFEQFKLGNLNATVEILERVNLPERLKNRLEEKQRIKNLTDQFKSQIADNELGIKQDMQAMQLAAEMYNLKMDFEKADEMYANLWALDTTNIDNALAYGDFSYSWNKILKAKGMYEKAYSLAYNKKDYIVMYNSLYVVGVINRMLNKHKRAIRFLEKSVELAEYLEKKYPNVFISSLVESNNSLANAYKASNQLYKSAATYGKAINNIIEGIKKCPEENWTPKLLLVYNDFSRCLRDLDNNKDAKKVIEEALKICVNKIKPQDSIAPLEIYDTYENAGAFYLSQNDYSKAAECYQKSFKIAEDLERKNSQKYLPYYSNSCNNYGNLMRKTLKLKDAGLLLRKAVEIDRKLAKEIPGIYLPKLAISLQNLSKLYIALQKFDESLKLAQESLSIFKKLLHNNSDAFEEKLIEANNNVSTVCYNLKQFDKAIAHLEESLRVSKKLAVKYPEAYCGYIAMIYANLGSMFKEKNDYEKSVSYTETALREYSKLAKKMPEKYLQNVALVNMNLGTIYSQMSRFNVAIAHAEKAISSYEFLSQNNHGAYDFQVGQAYGSLSVIYLNNYIENKHKDNISLGLASLEKAEQTLNKYKDLPNVAAYINFYKNIRMNFQEVSRSNKENIQWIQKQVSIIKNGKDIPQKNKYLIQYYEKLAWYLLLEKGYVRAENISKECLRLSSSSYKAKTYVAYAKLLQGHFEESRHIIEQFKDQPYSNDYRFRTFKDLYISDFKEMEEAGIKSQSLTRMVSYLNRN